MTKEKTASIEIPYGWIIIIASLLLNTIALGAPNILFVALKPIAADLGEQRWVPSLAYSLMMIGAGIGGIFMDYGWTVVESLDLPYSVLL